MKGCNQWKATLGYRFWPWLCPPPASPSRRSLTRACGRSGRERLQRLIAEGRPGAAKVERLHSLPMGPAGSTSLTRLLALVAAVISSVAVLIVFKGVSWPGIALSSIAALALLGLIHTLSSVAAATSGGADRPGNVLLSPHPRLDTEPGPSRPVPPGPAPRGQRPAGRCLRAGSHRD